MIRILTAIAFALSFGVLATTASASELEGNKDLGNPFPVYTTING